MDFFIATMLVLGVFAYGWFKLKEVLDRPKKMQKAIDLLEQHKLMGTLIPFVEADAMRYHMRIVYKLTMGDITVQAIQYGAVTPANMKGISLELGLFSNDTPSFQVYHQGQKIYSHGHEWRF